MKQESLKYSLKIVQNDYKKCGTNLEISFGTDSRINGGSRSNSFGNFKKTSNTLFVLLVFF
ncbi:hypothetical protein FNV40_11565 [Enterococcus durans]|nr:hypothetical protein FNV40_11565 [Enterococcus durans]